MVRDGASVQPVDPSMSGGELVKLENPIQWNVGQVISADGGFVFRRNVASDAVIVDLNYTTGLAWTEPVRLAGED